MTSVAFETLLDQARAAHHSEPALARFCPFPDDIRAQPVDPYHIPAADLVMQDTGLFSPSLAAFRDAFVAASPQAHWRETYKDTNIGQHFMDRFGCYCLIGGGGPFTSAQMASWVVYMPAGLHYTWHNHPSEELYLVLAGEAEFMREGEPSETLGPGDTSFHASNQPHAMTTHDHPVMAYVMWRNNLETPPVLTDREVQV
jgi:quercetin dioxygenase-like cupin family protein